MQLTPKRLAGPVYLDTAAAALCAAASGQTLLAKEMLLHNAAATTATYTIHLVPSGQTAGDHNRLFRETLDPDQTRALDLAGAGLVLAEGDSLSGLASAANAITVTICGAEVS